MSRQYLFAVALVAAALSCGAVIGLFRIAFGTFEDMGLRSTQEVDSGTLTPQGEDYARAIATGMRPHYAWRFWPAKPSASPDYPG